jgi:hypothetical protein
MYLFGNRMQIMRMEVSRFSSGSDISKPTFQHITSDGKHF